MILVNKMKLVSGAQFHNMSSVHCIVCSPPQVKSSSITIYTPMPSYTYPSSASGSHPTVVWMSFSLCFSFQLNHSTSPPGPRTFQPSIPTAISLLSISLSLCCLFLLFIRFHIWVKSYGNCLSITILFHLVSCCPGPSMLLQWVRLPSTLWPSSIPLCKCTTAFFVHSSIGGYLGCFQILAVVNNTAVNTGVHPTPLSKNKYFVPY